ncbi:MAG TPA: hypothetical protein VFZ69_14085 [Longimicrobiales bacterium]
MHELRQWWTVVVHHVIGFLGDLWHTVSYGLTQDWDLKWFILGSGLFLVFGLFTIWRRKA